MKSTMSRSIRTTSLLLLLGITALAASGCNTIEGVGKDTQKVGEEIQDEANEHKDGDDDDRTTTQTEG